jgi:hypothetical protein
MIALIILKMSTAKDHDVVTWKATSVDSSSQAAPRVFHTAMQTDLVPELLKKKNLDQSTFSSRRHLSTWAKSGIQINKGLGFMTNAHASMVMPAGGLRKNTLADHSTHDMNGRDNMQPRISNALMMQNLLMDQSQYMDGEPRLHISTLNIEHEILEMDRDDAGRSISESTIEESHPDCKFCDYCFKKMDDKREIVQTKKRMLRKIGDSSKANSDEEFFKMTLLSYQMGNPLDKKVMELDYRALFKQASTIQKLPFYKWNAWLNERIEQMQFENRYRRFADFQYAKFLEKYEV